MSQFRSEITKPLLQDLYCKQHLSSYAIAEKFSCHAATIRNHLRTFKLSVRSHKQAFRHRIFRKLPGKIIYPKRNFNADNARKAYLIGFRLGDLTVTHSSKGPYSQTLEVRGRTTQSAQLDLFKRLFHGYGHYYQSRPDRQGAIHLIYYLNCSFDFLLPKRDAVEPWIRHDPRCATSFAAGYIDAEGSFHLSSTRTGLPKAAFAIATQDTRILHWLYQWVRSMGVDCPAPYLAIPRETPRQWALHKNHWLLRITAKDSLLRIINILTPWIQHPKRRTDMIRVIQNIKERNQSSRLKYTTQQHREWASQFTFLT